MKRQIAVMISVVTLSFFIGTMFNVMAMDGENPFVKIWQAINGQQAKLDSLEAIVLELQTKIAELETEVNILKARKTGAPDYDSGWITLKELPMHPAGSGWRFIQHNLNTTNLLVYILAKTDKGSIFQNGVPQNLVRWEILAEEYGGDMENEMGLQSMIGDVMPYELRVMLWKIPEP